MTTHPRKHPSRMLMLSMTLFMASLGMMPPVYAADKDNWSWNFNWGGNLTKGSGKLITDKRALTGFDSLAVKGSHNIVLNQGAADSVEVLGDDNIVPMVETRLEGSTLVVTTKKGASFSTRNPITVNVTAKSLKAIAISGSGDVMGKALKTEALAVSISGSGNVKLEGLQVGSLSAVIAGSGDFTASGAAAVQNISISGSGDVRTDKLEGQDVTVKIAGSGDASVWAKNTLNASVAGSGDVSYVGDPKVTQRVAGSGSVSHK